MTPATATKISGFAGLATSITGGATGILAGVRRGKISDQLIDSATREAIARIEAGEVIRQNSIRNAFLSLKDAADTEQITQDRIDTVFSEGTRFIGSIRAASAASNIDPDEGSPLVTQVDAAIEIGRTADIEQRIATTRIQGFKFEAESFLLRGAQAARGSQRTARSILERGAFEAQAARIEGRSQIFKSVSGLLALTKSKTFQSLLKKKKEG